MIDLVAKAQVQAKTQDEKQRMKEAAVAIDFYNGRQKQHMLDLVSLIYPNTWQDIQHYVSTSNLTRGIIDKKAMLFLAPPEVELDTDNEALQQRFQELLDRSEFWKKLLVSDRMAELTGKVGICQHWHETDKRVVIDIITPDKCFVVADEQDPTKATIVYYVIGRDTDSRLATPVNVYAKWTADGYSEVALNENFKEIKTIKPPIPNQYGYIPIVWLSSLLEIDSFWVDHGYPIVDGNINVNLRASNLDLALDYQAFSTLVTRGLDQTKDFITGVTRRLYLSDNSLSGNSNAEAYYITPDAKLKDVSDIIEGKKVGYAKESGLSADAFNQDASKVSSGYQLRLTQKDLEEANELKKEVYRPQLVQLVKNMMLCYSISSSDFRFPTDIDVYFNYIDKEFAANPIETTTLQITKINANLMSLPDAIRENNPSLTQEEAIAEAARIKAENNAGTVRPITPEDLNRV